MGRQLMCWVACSLILSLAGEVGAVDVTWTGASADQLWNTPGNWDTGAAPTAADTAMINKSPGPVIAGDDIAVPTLWCSGSSELTVDSGTLTVSSVQLARAGGSHATMNVNGGVVTISGNLFLGFGGSGLLAVNGGRISVGGTLLVARKAASTGHVDLRGGTLATKVLQMRDEAGAVGTIDIGGGTLIVDGNTVPLIQGYIDNGWITAYDKRGGGTLWLDYDVTNKGKTTLIAIHSLKPNPAHGSSVGADTSQLQWTLPEPNQPGGIVTCDVYFGTNPKVEDNPKVVFDGAVESVAVTLNREAVYYWALDIYDSSVSKTEPALLSPIFTFDTRNKPPVIEAGEDMITWLIGGARVARLNVTVTDDGPYAVQWTVVSEPNDLNSPLATIADPNAEDTTIRLAAIGEYVLQASVFDGEFASSDTLAIDVYSDSCEAAQSMPGFVPRAADLNGDCRVDDADLKLLQENWLEENSLIDEWSIVD